MAQKKSNYWDQIFANQSPEADDASQNEENAPNSTGDPDTQEHDLNVRELLFAEEGPDAAPMASLQKEFAQETAASSDDSKEEETPENEAQEEDPFFGWTQTTVRSRPLLSLPVLAVGIALLAWQIGNPSGFGTVWQYVAWGTQVMAAITLWMCSVYLSNEGKCFWMTLLPAMFMTMVVADFFFTSPNTLGLNYWLSLALAAVVTLLATLRFATYKQRLKC